MKFASAALCLTLELGVAINVHINSAPIVVEAQSHQKLIVCNTFPSADGVHLSLNHHVPLTKPGTPLLYKRCERFSESLKEGDKLDFDLGDASKWTFVVDSVPNSPSDHEEAVMLLVMQKRSQQEDVPSFQSFVFPRAQADSAQVAMVDTYKGILNVRRVSIAEESKGPKSKPKSDFLAFNHVYAVSGGHYSLAMEHDGDDKAGSGRTDSVQFKAGHNYVVLRTGGDTDQDEDLVSFPQQQMDSHAAMSASALAGFLAVAAVML